MALATRSCIGRLARVAVFSTAALLAGAQATFGMQFSRLQLGDEKVLILGRGPIVQGDYDRLVAFVGTVPASDRIIGFSFDSPGGTIIEAQKIASLIHGTNSTVLIDANGECSSACFLLFAAAHRRVIAPNALIGVHSASSGGQETVATMAFTTQMARDAAGYEVPPAIIGKIVQTPPGRLAWLTSDDLASMGVIVLQDQTQSPPRSPPVASVPPHPTTPNYAAVAPLGAPEQQRSLAFRQGFADRQAWESWFAGLSGGAYRDGAHYWSAQRSLAQPGPCFMPDGSARDEWTAGCVAAKQRLDPTDVRRRGEPEYRSGWNSY
jgi:hypothetical protein